MKDIANMGLLEGSFIKELKNRFLCEVKINNESVVCYVPSSCHIGNFLQLEGKRVLLMPSQGSKTRTPYALFAVPFKKSFILLNSSIANKAIEVSIKSRKFYFLGKRSDVVREHNVAGYRADLFLPSTKTIIEVKSVISLNERATFPTVFSERTLKQLDTILKYLKSGYKACFMIVSLHPYLKSIELDVKSEFYALIVKCIDLGMILKAYTCRLKDNSIIIEKEIPVII